MHICAHTDTAGSGKGDPSLERLLPMTSPTLPQSLRPLYPLPTPSPSAITASQIQLLAPLSNQAPVSSFAEENGYVIISALFQTPF